MCLSVPDSGRASLFILPDLRLHLLILLVLSLKLGWFYSLINYCSSRLVASMYLMPSFSKESLGTPIIDSLLFWTFSTSSVSYIGRSPQIGPAYSKKCLILEQNMVMPTSTGSLPFNSYTRADGGASRLPSRNFFDLAIPF